MVECYNEINGIYGYCRVKIWLLRKYGIKVNYKRVYLLMKEIEIRLKLEEKEEITK
ncbi:transposase [Heyndrickxia sp. NPDC080065]|uniref:transposase n=1 Tax=Heyndrickxia sp. NPDC080065 TaxID=3390568 RepID=UPI003D051C53